MPPPAPPCTPSLPACPTGTYLDLEGQTLVSDCKLCAVGNFTPSMGHSECRVCGINEYSTGGAEACSPCRAGETTTDRGAHFCVCKIGFLQISARNGGGGGSDNDGDGHVDRSSSNNRSSSSRSSSIRGNVDDVCVKCPDGFVCETEGIVLATAQLTPGFWRAGEL